MKRLSLLVAAVALMIATFAPEASAEACFAVVAQAGGHPGEGVSTISTTLAEPGTPTSAVDDLAREVGLINQAREEICPPEGP